MIRQKRLERRIEELDEDEKLIAESNRACDCFDMDELMRDCVALFDDLVRLDEHFRFRVFCDPALYSAEVDRNINGLFDRWHDVAGRILSLFGRIETDCSSRGFDDSNHNALKDRYATSSAAMNPSSRDTFLADEAISQHREGLTVPM